MTDNEINAAITEAMGQIYHRPTEEEKRTGSYYQYELDYCHDLNAMNSAEKILDGETVDKRSLYHDFLYCVIADEMDRDGKFPFADAFERSYAMLRATARQRAEAFLRTIGKWRDNP